MGVPGLLAQRSFLGTSCQPSKIGGPLRLNRSLDRVRAKVGVGVERSCTSRAPCGALLQGCSRSGPKRSH